MTAAILRVGENKKGFSLLELLVVLLLLALSSALVIPAIDAGLKQRQVRRSALELAAVARGLRRTAIYHGSLQSLVLDPSESSYEAFGGNKVVLPADVRISAIQGGEPTGQGLTRFLFFPNGSILSGEIGLSGGEGSAYLIRLDPLSGRVLVERESRP
ncbi:MAG: prepilin-type N-terminal cleavage/methylation domain-containing protein [Deltaproteobacteria bacterium]|nr:prepilin-type N-terminal cleavage/methylation domain-containing protein [Deltaproteobacteria bacterium]